MTDTPNYGPQLAQISKQLEQLIALTRASTLPADGVLTFNHNGKLVKLVLPSLLHDRLQQFIYRTGNFYELPLLARIKQLGLIDQRACVLDVGANIGNHSAYFAKVLRAGRLFAFEPQEYCQYVLKQVFALNALEHAELVPAMVGPADGFGRTESFKAVNYGATSFAASEDGDVRMVSLDGFVAAREIAAVDFIKIDVEGHAADVLSGATKVLQDLKPRLWIELRPGTQEHTDATAILDRCGYVEKERLNKENILFHHPDRPIDG